MVPDLLAGDLLLCDGTCMRGFHVQTEEEGGCNPMRMPADLFERVQVSVSAPFVALFGWHRPGTA